MKKLISVIIPVRNEKIFIKDCINSIINSDYPEELLELLVVDGMSQDGTRLMVEEFVSKYSYIKVIENKYITAQFGINIGINNSTGDYIFILGCHALYPVNYFSKLSDTAQKFSADCVGGIIVTDVKIKNHISESIKLVLGDILGVGNSTFRIGADRVKEVDTVAYGCYNSNVFKKYGLFNEKLVRNQDIEYNKRIKNQGAKIFIDPSVCVTYYARDNYLSLIINNYENGFWNILTTYYTKTFKSLSLRHFIPLIFILVIIFSTFMGFFYLSSFWLTLFVLFTYFFTILTRSFTLNNIYTKWYYLFITFLLIHFSYGLGSLFGIFKTLFLKVKKFAKNIN